MGRGTACGSRIEPGTAKGCAEGTKPTVRILDNLFGPHMDYVGQAMGRATQRQSLLTANLANVNTPGYKRQDLDFNIILEREMHAPRTRMQEMLQRGKMQIKQDGSLRVDGNNVDMEKEVMAIAETELRYQALSDMAAQYFAGLKNVIKEGR
jgi:flagellar basal-body rod protein FlgB